MKKTIITILAAALLASGSAAYAYLPDIDKTAVDNKILEGDENGDLKLDEYITRAEMSKIVCSIMSETDDSNSDITLSDIKNHWAEEYIKKAVSLGAVNGFEDKSFRPDDYVTYEQAVKMIVGNGEALVYPTDYISFAIENGLLENVNAICGEYITRGDVAQIIINLKEAVKDGAISDTYTFSMIRSLAQTETDLLNDSAANFKGSSPMSAGAVGSSGLGGGGSVSMAVPECSIMADSLAESDANNSFVFNPYGNNESYVSEDENIFKNAALSPLSTFSIDVDTASYSNLRRFVVSGQRVPMGSVRTEELINYFDYDLPQPTDGTPFSVTTEIAECPWNSENKLAMINVQGEELTERSPQNLVFLMDISGSMYSYNKLPLVKRSMELLLSKLDERDTISIVTYASGVNVVASGIKASEKDELMGAINSLYAGGGTNGAGGIQLAYEQAEKFKCDGNNRIILCTDGDFNIGVSDNDELKKLISEKRDSNIFLSVLGFGMGNYKDDKLEIIADNGNGGYYYIDNLREAKKVLVDEMTSTLYTIAKDVKIQVEFNPAQVESYRLIGYENRRLQNEQFADDKVDAGELGAGSNVTALYELVMAKDGAESVSAGEELRYQTPQYRDNGELMNVKLRYKLPNETESTLKEYPIDNKTAEAMSDNFRFASGVAELGMLINDSEYKGSASYDNVIELARGALGDDPYGNRREFIQMVDLMRFFN